MAIRDCHGIVLLCLLDIRGTRASCYGPADIRWCERRNGCDLCFEVDEVPYLGQWVSDGSKYCDPYV